MYTHDQKVQTSRILHRLQFPVTWPCKNFYVAVNLHLWCLATSIFCMALHAVVFLTLSTLLYEEHQVPYKHVALICVDLAENFPTCSAISTLVKAYRLSSYDVENIQSQQINVPQVNRLSTGRILITLQRGPSAAVKSAILVAPVRKGYQWLHAVPELWRHNFKTSTLPSRVTYQHTFLQINCTALKHPVFLATSAIGITKCLLFYRNLILQQMVA
jgi:hypothetical protein